MNSALDMNYALTESSLALYAREVDVPEVYLELASAPRQLTFFETIQGISRVLTLLHYYFVIRYTIYTRLESCLEPFHLIGTKALTSAPSLTGRSHSAPPP
jgi:hypothetical protein